VKCSSKLELIKLKTCRTTF